MADRSLPLLRGKTVARNFRPVVGGARAASRPRPDPATHRLRLLAQLDAVVLEAGARPAGERDPDATRELIAVRPFDPDDPPKAEQLGDLAHGVRVVGTDHSSGVVLLDAPGPQLDRLREKAAEYGVPKERKNKDGSITTSPAHVAALGPVSEIGRASERDLVGPRLRAWIQEARLPSLDAKLWYELACRGGYRNPKEWSANSRVQINRQVMQLAAAPPEEFEATEELIFFTRLSLTELRCLATAVDCIFTYDVVPSEILTWLLLKDPPRQEIRTFVLVPPPASAPSVVILDTGIATEHPLLKPAMLGATSVVPGFLDAPGDTFGHGTKMAGAALYPDLGRAIEERRFAASHWIQSVRLIVEPGKGISADENRPFWPKLTVSAVTKAEDSDPLARRRVFALAVTFRVDPLIPTSWAQAINQLAYDDGKGRLFCVSAGNVRPEDLFATANAYPDSLFQWKIHEPAQGSNALTVGAYTAKTVLPPEADYEESRPVAPAGGASPHTTTGPAESPWAIKPDIVMEGGNVALSTAGAVPDAETLVTLTTGHRPLTSPLALISMTSEAAARAARMAVDVWKQDDSLRPETVRGLLVHAASWTPMMREQFGEPDLFHACGYGVPDLDLARACAANRATVIVEDTMPNSVLVERPRRTPPRRTSTPPTEMARQRRMKIFRMPAPEEVLLAEPDANVELRVTLSYFAEPSTYRTTIEHGLDLKWDMQGPQETEEEFLARTNDLHRERGKDGKKIKKDRKPSFPWQIGINRRSRGTVQSDRWAGKASLLAGSKLIAVCPVLGWWERRDDMQVKEAPFSLIVSIVAPGIYAAVQAELATIVPIEVS
jgi:hypothetical protein